MPQMRPLVMHRRRAAHVIAPQLACGVRRHYCMDARIDTSGGTNAIASWIWRNLVPKNGQATTVQGELLRAVEKLRWEAQQNGNINWGGGFAILIDYLQDTLTDYPGFNSSDRTVITSDLARLGEAQGCMPYVEDDLSDRLTEYVVTYSRDNPVHIARPDVNR